MFVHYIPHFYFVFFSNSHFLCLSLSFVWDFVHGVRKEDAVVIIHDISELDLVCAHMRLWGNNHGFFLSLNWCRATAPCNPVVVEMTTWRRRVWGGSLQVVELVADPRCLISVHGFSESTSYMLSQQSRRLSPFLYNKIELCLVILAS